MKTTTTLIGLLLTTVLITSCRTKIICAEVRSATVKPLPLCDISFQFNECYCRCFDLNQFKTIDEVNCKWKYGEFKEGSYPLNTCEGLSGFYVEDMLTEIKPKIKKLNRIKRDNCK